VHVNRTIRTTARSTFSCLALICVCARCRLVDPYFWSAHELNLTHLWCDFVGADRTTDRTIPALA
jgi:hypothetical protein